LNGCECGSRVFFFIRGPGENNEGDRIEQITAVEKGVYEIDVARLLEARGKKPLIVRDHHHTYFVKLPSPKTQG
jgi:predicted  nucleic acid-binding Zn-ribbon protein